MALGDGLTEKTGLKSYFCSRRVDWYKDRPEECVKRKWIPMAGGALLLLFLPYFATLLLMGGKEPGQRVQIPESGRSVLRTGPLGTEAVDIEEYAVGVAAAQIPGDYEKEAVKAQIIVARTYLYKTLGGEASIEEAGLSCGYLDEEERRSLWGKEAGACEEKFRSAAAETAGRVLVCEGSLIEPMFHRASAGRTRDGGTAFPYLKPVDSEQDLEMEGFIASVSLSAGEAAECLGGETDPEQAMGLQISARDSSGYVTGILVGTREYTGAEAAEAFGLPSSAFSVSRTENGLEFTVKGSGHGYGLSQYGADCQARMGQEAEAILSYYFQNTSIENILEAE